MSRLILAGTALLLLFFLYTAPARLMGHFLPQPQVLASGYEGGFWEGSAQTMAIAVSGGYVQLGRVQWRLRPWSLLLLSPRLELETAWGQQRIDADLQVSPSGSLRLRDSKGSVDAGLLRRLLPIQVDGLVSVQVSDLKLDSQGAPQRGEGRLVWQQARWFGSRGASPLGSYVAEFEVTDAGQVEALVTSLNGPILINGSATLQGSQLALDALINSDQPFHPELATPLQLVATPVDGGFQLQMSLDL